MTQPGKVDQTRINPWKCRWCGEHFVVSSLTDRHEPRCELNPRST